MKILKSIWNFITWPWRKWQEHRAFKKKLKELRTNDPFIHD